MKVIIEGHIKIPQEDLDNVKKHLASHIENSKDNSGCLYFSIKQNINDPLIFDVYEEFKDSAAYFLHVQGIKGSVWGKVTKNVERVYKISGLEKQK